MRVKFFIFLPALLSVSPFVYSQPAFPYYSAWKKIDNLLQKKSLPRSALIEVDKVYAAAKKERREDQWIKAAIYRIQLTENGQDEPGFRLGAWDSAMAGAPVRVKAVLLSAEAAAVGGFSQRSRYRRSDQTTVTGDSSTDLSTWPFKKIDSLQSKLYLLSLAEKKWLQGTSLKGYETILLKGNSRKLRPTLYDLLLFRALDYFMAKDDDETPAGAAWHPESDPMLFVPANRFRQLKWSDVETSGRLTALRLFQDILSFHAPDADASASVDADIDRIQFVHSFSTVPGKDRLYFEALEQITSSFPGLPAAAEAGYLQASCFLQSGALYDAVADTAHRFDLVQAKAIADRYASSPEPSAGKSDCINLVRRLELKTLEVETEKVNLPGLPFRALVSYKNADRLYGRIIRIDDATRQSLSTGFYSNESWQKLAHFPAEKNFVFSLPVTNDFQVHRMEIPIDALTIGEYALLTSSDSTFSVDAALSVNFFSSSFIAVAWQGKDGFVAHRSSGKPLARVKVVAYHNGYNSKTGRNELFKDGVFITDAGGRFREVYPDNRNYEHTYVFSLKDDRLTIPDLSVYSYSNADQNAEKDDEQAFDERWRRASLFTDRGIYRPGQAVYVKTLMMTRDFTSKAYHTVATIHSKLYLRDVNQQPIDSIAYVTSAFGSFSTVFHLPLNLLTGSFGIQDSLTGSTTDFSVEEYKRPKFFVDIDTPAGPWHLNDSVRFEGTAKAYAGNPIDGATVNYRVFREARFPYPWYFRNIPASQEQQLTSGTTVTDAQGKFVISFKALPDLSVAAATKPVFRYRVSADVTDANGEAHDAVGSVALGAQSFQIVSPLPEESVFSADSLIHFPVTTQDLNDRFQAHELTVSLYALNMPDRLIRQRYWRQPDQYLMDKASYVRMFPNDEYSDETNKVSWSSRELIVSQHAETTADGRFPLNVNDAQRLSGWFLVVIAGVDTNGDSIIDKRWIALGIDKSKKPLYPEYNLRTSGITRGEPGTSVPALAGSSADVFVLRTRVSTADSVSELTRFELNNEVKSIPVKITEADRGGFSIEDMFIKDNRIYTNRHVVVVPWSNKALTVQFKTWRDKTLPGSKETWSLHIDGPGKDRSVAEILSAMYDASLDAFVPFSWQSPDIYPYFSSYRNLWSSSENFETGQTFHRVRELPVDEFPKQYDALLDAYLQHRFGRPVPMPMMSARAAGVSDNAKLDEPEVAKSTSPRIMESKDMVPGSSPGRNKEKDSALVPLPENAGAAVAIRKNFNETAFFFPDLKTDAEGDVSFSFTMPEALTKWKWMVFAHTRDLAFGQGEKSVITQKELMLMPNMPRFLRQGDSLQIPVKISNLADTVLSGTVRLDWRDAGDSSERNTAFGNSKPEQCFSVPARQSRTYFFNTVVAGSQQQPVYYRLTATTSGTALLSDGEEGILPVLSNRRLVTETLPLRLNKENGKTVDWDKLLHSDSSNNLQQHSLTVEYTTRPAWYAVQSLPYLMEFPYECAEQTFDRYYANALGSQIVNRVPGMAGVLAAWKSGDSSALQSNLEKNPDLKSVLLKETPWVVEANSETAQKQQLAKLLDQGKLSSEMKKAIGKLQVLQSGAGGFPWFAGGRDDRYITQYIVTGIGHLMKLKALPEADRSAYGTMVKKALVFLDAEIKRDYDNRPKKGVDNLAPMQIQYLYMRSFFRDIDVPGASFFALNYYRQLAQQHWSDQNMYLRGMIALFLNRNGDKKTAQDILKSLRENAIASADNGTYWKRSGSGFYWQESPVETQSLLIEAFAELGASGETDNMKWWLLQQKQTNHWSSTRSTADACYALLMNGSDWLGNDQSVTIKLGKETIKTGDATAEAGTGYFKKVFPAENVSPSMGHITVSASAANGNPVPSFGAVYWQYFEEMGNITAANTSLGITRTLFVQKNTDKGVVGEALPEGAVLHAGDKLLLRFIIKTDRDLSYVQLKDQRAACLEPVQVLSGYQWQGDLGYYQAPGDESTSFFFDFLPKGTHVVEYSVYVSTNGVFSGGICTLQTLYAPEFAAHTAGSRLRVTEK